jgi:RHS repeat-associated protein
MLKVMELVMARIKGAISFVFPLVVLSSCVGGGGPPQLAETSEAVTLAITLSNGVGRLVSSGNGLARTFHSYDARGRSVATERVLDGTSYVYRTTYGFPCASDACTGVAAAGNGSVAITQAFPDNEVVRYTFDAGGGSQSIAATPSGGATQTIVSRVLRNARGQTTEVDYGDATSTTHHYNDATDLRLSQIETFLTATPSTILQLYTYAFDHNGNVTGVNDYCNEASTTGCTTSAANTIYSWSYQYDARDQLLKGTRNGAVYAYSYDALGNLTSKEGVIQTYFPSGAGQPRPHALSAVGAVKYGYDANGNVTGTSGGTTNVSIAWNPDDMPERTVYGSVTTNKSFVGESLWKKAQGTNITYYLPATRVENGRYRKYFGPYAERDGADTSSCTTNAATGCLKFYHGDHLGSSTLVTSDAGAVIHRQSYKPYGEDLLASPPGPFTPAAGLRYQYNFKEKEQDGSGLYDYGARLYNPATARFLSPDTSDADGLNRYAYVSNDPLRYNDPTGHQQEEAERIVVIDGQILVEDPGAPCQLHAPPRHFWAAPAPDQGRIEPGTLGLDWIVGGRVGSLVADLGFTAVRGIASRLATSAAESAAQVAAKAAARSTLEKFISVEAREPETNVYALKLQAHVNKEVQSHIWAIKAGKVRPKAGTEMYVFPTLRRLGFPNDLQAARAIAQGAGVKVGYPDAGGTLHVIEAPVQATPNVSYTITTSVNPGLRSLTYQANYNITFPK